MYLIFLVFWSHSVLLRIGQYTKSTSRISQTHSSRGLLRKYFLKICSKFTGEHPWRSVISIKLLCNFIKIKLRHGCSPVNLLHIFRAPFSKNNSRGLLLISQVCISQKVKVVILAISVWLLIYGNSTKKKSKIDNYLVRKYKKVQLLRKLFVSVNVVWDHDQAQGIFSISIVYILSI